MYQAYKLVDFVLIYRDGRVSTGALQSSADPIYVLFELTFIGVMNQFSSICVLLDAN